MLKLWRVKICFLSGYEMNVVIGILRYSIVCEDSGLSDGKFVRKDLILVRFLDIGELKDFLDIF